MRHINNFLDEYLDRYEILSGKDLSKDQLIVIANATKERGKTAIKLSIVDRLTDRSWAEGGESNE